MHNNLYDNEIAGGYEGPDWEPEDYSAYEEIPDWGEVSGWNDIYGSDVEVSDIIEFRDCFLEVVPAKGLLQCAAISPGLKGCGL